MVLVLACAAVTSGLLGETGSATLILAILGSSLILDLLQTHRSGRAIASLQERVVLRAMVLRDGICREMPVREIVPGDVFLLEAGDRVPADGCLLESRDLFVDESVLTGESVPAEKHVNQPGQLPRWPPEVGWVSAGTAVIGGTARVLAIRTGRTTTFGHLASSLEETPPSTEFERGLNEFAVLILRTTMWLVTAVFVVLAGGKHEPLEAFQFAIALAVGLTPEFLPMVVTVTLASGALRMARQGVIVKQLQAIENLGSLDVLCCDKTGTLTSGEQRLETAVDGQGKPSRAVLVAAALTSRFTSGTRNPLETCLRDQVLAPDETACRMLDEWPFDFHRRRMSVLLDRGQGATLVCKGAPEAVLEVCNRLRTDSGDRPLSSSERTRLETRVRELGGRGLRVLAVAERRQERVGALTPEDERDLVFTGLLGFRDSPRAGGKESLERLARDGIRVLILTGDQLEVTRHVAREVGLAGGETLTGPEMDTLEDRQLLEKLQRVHVVARMRPEQKVRVVRLLKDAGQVVGFLGDGVNDAPSLRIADVGISVDRAVDVAREAAPILLGTGDLRVLHEAILEGRRSFTNVMTYLRAGTSSNFGNMLSMAIASMALPFLPLLPAQLLLANLLTDSAMLGIPGDTVDRMDLVKPRHWNLRQIRTFMLVMGPLSSLFDMITFVILLVGFKADTGQFRTGWFIESLLTQILVAYVVRTRGPAWQSRPARSLIATSVGACAGGIALALSPWGHVLGFTPIGGPMLGTIAILVPTYLLVASWTHVRCFR